MTPGKRGMTGKHGNHWRQPLKPAMSEKLRSVWRWLLHGSPSHGSVTIDRQARRLLEQRTPYLTEAYEGIGRIRVVRDEAAIHAREQRAAVQ